MQRPMVDKSKPRGRPRKYKNDAERKKAYRERQKAKRSALEQRIDELERKVKTTSDESETVPVEPLELHEEIGGTHYVTKTRRSRWEKWSTGDESDSD